MMSKRSGEERSQVAEVNSNLHGEDPDLREARAGDHAAFARAVSPYRDELHRHCYRMTGSFDDADDVLQETLFRAWRSLGTYAGRSSFRAWLYRIATNRSIDVLGGKGRQEVPVEWEGQTEGLDPSWLQAYPDSDPAELAERREHIATAFVVAIQKLPPKQRAALLLKDVLGFSVPEIAETLDTTEASINSALQRARAATATEPTMRPTSRAEAELRDQLIEAWQAADIEGLTRLLADDVVLTMPPDPVRVDGSTAVIDFLSTIAPNGRLEEMKFVPTSANRQPAAALYLPHDDGTRILSGLMVLDVGAGRVKRMTAFRIPNSHAVRFGVPAVIHGPGAS